MTVNRYRKVLENDKIELPGLEYFGHSISSKAGLPLDTHIHENCLEIVAVIKGNECYFVEERRFELSGGDVFISYVNQPHRSGNAAQGVCEIIWFQINPSVSENFLGLSGLFEDLIKYRLLNIDTHILKTDKEGISYLKKSFENFLKPKTENNIYAQSLFIAFLTKLLFMENKSESNNILIEKILRHINENICENIKIEEVCSLFNISLSGFKHKFREYTGMTPRDYINSRKIHKATEMLISGINVTETAMALSFNTSDYFSVVFKKYMACSPSQFKNKLGMIK